MLRNEKGGAFKAMQTWRLKFKHEKCFIKYLVQQFDEINTISLIFKVRNLVGKLGKCQKDVKWHNQKS